jgi:hypothetical protein
MSGQTIFSVTNHHVASCGLPPHIEDTSPNCYRGYFENEHGEQAIFVYDRASREATLYMGDAVGNARTASLTAVFPISSSPRRNRHGSHGAGGQPSVHDRRTPSVQRQFICSSPADTKTLRRV